MITLDQKLSVRVAKHFLVYDYPKNWCELAEYSNWYNSLGQLCGFVEVCGYLTTTVY